MRTTPKGDAIRQRIIEYLKTQSDGAMLKEVARASDLKLATAHWHLKRLQQWGVVTKTPRIASIRLREGMR